MTGAVIWGVQPPGPIIDGGTGPGERAFRDACSIGRADHNDIVIDGVVIGGMRNCKLSARDGGWTFEHMGHAIPVLVEGRAIDRECPLHHGDVVEPVAVSGIPHGNPVANPRLVLAVPDPHPASAGQAVLWSPGGDARLIRTGRSFLIAPSRHADLALPGAPLLRIRHTDGAWHLDHLDRGPPVAIGSHTLQDATRELHHRDVLEWPGAAPLVFELR